MRLRLAVVALFTVLIAILGGGVASAFPTDIRASVVPQCTDISFKGNTGQINIRTSSNRFVAWNIAMFDSWANDGPWTVHVYVNNRKVDAKKQDYQPHGSINPRDLPASSFVSIEAWHTDRFGGEHYFVPNQCYVP
ncbi:hypothetical protein GCM10023201_21110 [Actinomycetospora corticicola]|uniref:Uncharacterized protein n=1 Tax=Actinomycetospora corticicola TaxID=663602 RepID=A0A7Y9DRL7_9PSEU|nr:hypothetical protein [Actinomycetospora corticicola]NYD34173.1 hypothetical protein [Actinomycetospora corticicola]